MGAVMLALFIEKGAWEGNEDSEEECEGGHMKSLAPSDMAGRNSFRAFVCF